jgi:hypothetical protein
MSPQFVMWLVKQHIPNLGKNYLVIDPACGSGNLVIRKIPPTAFRCLVAPPLLSKRRHFPSKPRGCWNGIPFFASSFQTREESGRTSSRRHMDQEPENVIFSYTDAQALEDGVLVAVDFAPVNRVTRSVTVRLHGIRHVGRGGPPFL